MTRGETMTAIRTLAAGLEADDAGIRRLLERISVHDAAETLRDALVEAGAAALLEDVAGQRIGSGF